ncbi:hypothetical protein GCM10009859_24440 [Kocuria salsicia]
MLSSLAATGTAGARWNRCAGDPQEGKAQIGARKSVGLCNAGARRTRFLARVLPGP